MVALRKIDGGSPEDRWWLSKNRLGYFLEPSENDRIEKTGELKNDSGLIVLPP
jgi:hypothetical protein